jgi:FkbH-like protein
MYRADTERFKAQFDFANYSDYLKSLEMKAEIRAFEPVYLARIAQLTNKSNQFNLTTKRFTESELKSFATDEKYITLYGKLSDKYGDNGVVTVLLGRAEADTLHIDLWLMSCRVLKRNMEHAMLDALVKKAREKKIT